MNVREMEREIDRLHDLRSEAETLDQRNEYTDAIREMNHKIGDAMEDWRDRRDMLRAEYEAKGFSRHGDSMRAAILHTRLERHPHLKSLIITPSNTKKHKLFIVGVNGDEAIDHTHAIAEVLRAKGAPITIATVGDENSGAIGVEAEGHGAYYPSARAAIMDIETWLRKVTGIAAITIDR